MADHGDDVAEFLLTRSFNPYNARQSIQFILSASKKRFHAQENGRSSETIGHHTLDFKTDYESLKHLEGFKVEKLSSFDAAAVKTFVIKNVYKLEAVQVKDCILMRTDDYIKLATPEIQKDIEAKIAELAKDPLLLSDICVKAKIEDQHIEQELFTKLPYAHERMSTKERITKRNVNASKAKVLNKNKQLKQSRKEVGQMVAK